MVPQRRGVAQLGLRHIESTPLPATLELRKTRSRKRTAAMRNQADQYRAFDVHQATVVGTARKPGSESAAWYGANRGVRDCRCGAKSRSARAHSLEERTA